MKRTNFVTLATARRKIRLQKMTQNFDLFIIDQDNATQCSFAAPGLPSWEAWPCHPLHRGKQLLAATDFNITRHKGQYEGTA